MVVALDYRKPTRVKAMKTLETLEFKTPVEVTVNSGRKHLYRTITIN